MNATASSSAPPLTGRLHREWRTISVMLVRYCRDQHQSEKGLCPECQELLDYAELRLQRCRFGQQKPTCANCPVHCYQPKHREKVREMMRYSGPKMLTRHPILAILHMLDGRRPVPKIAPASSS